MKSLLKVIAVSFVFSFAPAAHSAIDCEQSPGKQLCSQIRRLESLFVACNGDACTSLWRDQIHSMKRFVDYYYREIPVETTGSEVLGQWSYRLASTICRYSWDGDLSQIQQIQVAANRTLPVLRDIQRFSGVANPRFCTITLK